ncbi:AraC-like DNA-binding protein [Aquimarina sp. MAR_2010_214]|uniref:helix-turn-helix domain-containing protein n=1 Tax=Aquimarina sp. MAR_2010_214 TaxID=1250026 RepID=UPI000C7125AE|nr:AraC family transcriptional regulator [Aquimarina sp. MAR_2010_214]PKV48238.1 AraC-like DNA-binding protein [Aquimarina sp. MAR_2010_214]
MPRTIFDNIVIQHFEKMTFFDFCQYTSIRFFEVVHFIKGNGTIKINGSNVSYHPNSFFVFIPDDVYILQVDTPTTGTTIKFLKSFFNNSTIPVNDWFRKIETVLSNESRLEEFEFQSKSDKQNLASLMKMLYEENQDKQFFDAIIVQNTLSTILRVIARNASQAATLKSSKHQNSKIQDIINYIHHHIYESDLITNKTLAEKFNIADNYIGQYFKKQMDISLKKYILNYKLKLAETRLKYTDLHFSEIASELGFTDASHLNKTFLAYKGVTIGEFRTSQK